MSIDLFIAIHTNTLFYVTKMRHNIIDGSMFVLSFVGRVVHMLIVDCCILYVLRVLVFLFYSATSLSNI
jgi:hypothetical protein